MKLLPLSAILPASAAPAAAWGGATEYVGMCRADRPAEHTQQRLTLTEADDAATARQAVA